jgi:lipoprotein LprG
MEPSRYPTRRTAALASSVLVLALALTGCGGGSGAGTSKHDVETVLAKAKKNFDKATGVHFTMTTDADPSGDAVLGADGKLTDQPAFEGTVKAKYKGFHVDVPVVSVDRKFYANLPFSGGFKQHDPSEFNAPDPADFIVTDKGFSAALRELQGAKQKSEKRQGSTIVTTYAGTLSGSLIASIVPSANPDKAYQAVVGIADDQLTTLKITGDFFDGDGDATFTLVFDDYNKVAKISAP